MPVPDILCCSALRWKAEKVYYDLLIHLSQTFSTTCSLLQVYHVKQKIK